MLASPVRPVASPVYRPVVAAPRRVSPTPTLSTDSVRLSAPKVSTRPSKDWLAVRSAEGMTVPHRYQGEDASCGPSSLWAVLGFHQGRNAVDFTTLDRSLRPTGRFNNRVGTTPTALAQSAREHGMAASVTNGADTAHLRKLLDAGLPAILLGTWTDGRDTDLHFVVVNGYDGSDDATTRWHLTDSYVEGNNGRVVYSTPQLMAFWHCRTGKGVPYPYNRAVVNIAPAVQAADLPKDNRTAGLKMIDGAMIAGTNVLRLFDNRRR